MTKPTGATPGEKGRFTGYDVLAQKDHWDEVTREVVLSRLQERDRLSFFSGPEAETARALFDLILAQHDEPRVPVLELVDKRLGENETDGWRYEDMPEDRDAWRQSLALLDADANETFEKRFVDCSRREQGALVQAVQDAETWHGWKGAHLWSLWTRYTCAAFYAHPWAWNEIGFGGPAYPRGYKVLRVGWKEPFEVSEHDAEDPVPWASRTEQARRAHEVNLPKP